MHALQDPHSQQHLHFMRYYMAEGALIGQVGGCRGAKARGIKIPCLEML